jgi:hypothetical protein
MKASRFSLSAVLFCVLALCAHFVSAQTGLSIVTLNADTSCKYPQYFPAITNGSCTFSAPLQSWWKIAVSPDASSVSYSIGCDDASCSICGVTGTAPTNKCVTLPNGPANFIYGYVFPAVSAKLQITFWSDITCRTMSLPPVGVSSATCARMPTLDMTYAYAALGSNNQVVFGESCNFGCDICRHYGSATVGECKFISPGLWATVTKL